MGKSKLEIRTLKLAIRSGNPVDGGIGFGASNLEFRPEGVN